MSKKAILVFAMLCAHALSGFAQNPANSPAISNVEYQIRGKLIFPTPKPPQDRIEVFLEKNAQRVQSTYTDASGNFEFRSLNPGDYNVIARVPQFEEVNQALMVYANHRMTAISIQMTPVFAVTTRAPGFEGDDPDLVDVSTIKNAYPKKAIQEYEKAIEENKKGATDKAIVHLERATQLAPDFYHAFNNLGVALVKVNRYSEAETSYRRAAQLNPKATQPLLNLGILYINQSDLNKAIECLELAVKLKPASAVSHYFLGTAYYKSASFERAELLLKRARELDPTFGKTRIALVNVYTKQMRLREALEEIDAFLRDNPNAEERSALQEVRAKIIKGIGPGR